MLARSKVTPVSFSTKTAHCSHRGLFVFQRRPAGNLDMCLVPCPGSGSTRIVTANGKRPTIREEWYRYWTVIFPTNRVFSQTMMFNKPPPRPTPITVHGRMVPPEPCSPGEEGHLSKSLGDTFLMTAGMLPLHR